MYPLKVLEDKMHLMKTVFWQPFCGVKDQLFSRKNSGEVEKLT